MVALNKDTARLDAAIVAAVRDGKHSVTGVHCRLVKEKAADSMQERKVVKRMDALRRQGILVCVKHFWTVAEKVEAK